MIPARLVLPSPGGPGEQHVVDGLAPPAGRLEDDLEVALELGLADELGERAGPQAGLGGDLDLVAQLLGPQQLLAHGAFLPPGGGQPLQGVAQQARRHRRRGAGRPSPRGSRARCSRARRGPRGRRPAAAARPRRTGPPGTTVGPPRSGTERRDLRSMSSRAAVFLPTPGHEAQRAEVVLGEDAGQRDRACGSRGSPAPAPGPRRGHRAAPRSTPARPWWRSRRG